MGQTKCCLGSASNVRMTALNGMQDFKQSQLKRKEQKLTNFISFWRMILLVNSFLFFNLRMYSIRVRVLTV